MEERTDAAQRNSGISIASSDTMPHLLSELRELFESEWEQLDPFEGNHDEIVVPSPLIAIYAQGQLVGGLAFSSYSKPESADIGVWINAVLVDPGYRKRGVASRLIQSAELAASRVGVSDLFVLTDIPNMYQKLGWASISVEGNDSILSKNIEVNR